MALTPIEIIATILALLSLIKLITISINKKAWINSISKPILKNQTLTGVVLAILGIIILYFLLQELSIVQIFAVMSFMSVMMGLGFLSYSKELVSIMEKLAKQKFSTLMWIYILIWLFLVLWVLYSIFLI